jgi:hypothetical protein
VPCTGSLTSARGRERKVEAQGYQVLAGEKVTRKCEKGVKSGNLDVVVI